MLRHRLPWQKPPRGALLNTSHELAKGLVGCWIMNEDGSAVFDHSGRQQTGILYNTPTWVPGGIEFVRSNSEYMRVADADLAKDFPAKSGTSNDEVTLSCIFKYRTLPGSWVDYWLITKRTSGDGELYLFLYKDDTDHHVRFGCANYQQYDYTITSFVQVDVWYHVVCTYNRNVNPSQKTYWNGVLKATNNGTNDTIDGTSGSWMVAAKYDGGTDHFDGSVAHTMVWNRALTAEEVAWLYREPYAMFTETRRIDISRAVHLQVYNQKHKRWDTLDSENTPTADTEFTLTGSVS